jgi:transcriptional regulator with XRE-family HTH domain
MTQDELAARLGLTGAMVSRYETGQRRINLDVLAAIAEVLGMHMKDLFDPPIPRLRPPPPTAEDVQKIVSEVMKRLAKRRL